MSPCLCTVLVAALVVGPAPVSGAPSFDEVEARVQEHLEKGRFAELAAAGEAGFRRTDLSAWQRRALAFFAVRGLHGVFAVDHAPEGLCRARRLLRAVEDEVGLADDAATAQRLRALTERELAGHTCERRSSPRRARAVPSPTPGDEVLLPVVASQADRRDRREIPPPAAPEVATVRAAETGDNPRAAVVAEAQPHVAVEPPREPGRSPGRLIGGSVLLVAGAALGVGFGLGLRGRDLVDAQIARLDAEIAARHRRATPEELAAGRRLNDSYRDLTIAAGAAGSAAIVALVTGVALLAAPSRRPRAMAAAPWAGPWGAGISLGGRF